MTVILVPLFGPIIVLPVESLVVTASTSKKRYLQISFCPLLERFPHLVPLSFERWNLILFYFLPVAKEVESTGTLLKHFTCYVLPTDRYIEDIRNMKTAQNYGRTTATQKKPELNS